MNSNPYDWQGYRPQVVVPRPEVASVLARLQRGGSAVVLAGRGMGKSVFLQQLEAAAAELPDMRVVRFPAPPPELSYRACLRALAHKLGVEAAAEVALDSSELISGFLRQAGAPRRLILLYDEFDRYAHPPLPTAEHPGRDFFNDLEAMRKEYSVGILAAGSIGVFVFRDVLGTCSISYGPQAWCACKGRRPPIPSSCNRFQASSIYHHSHPPRMTSVTASCGIWRASWPSCTR